MGLARQCRLVVRRRAALLQARENNADFDGEYHGKGGPLAVNKSRTGNPVQQIFLQAAQEAQFRLREDFNADEHEGSASIN
jgi:choline dehydrogenase-like flavoprotein